MLAAFDALPTPAVLLDASADVVRVDRARREFGEANGLAPGTTDVGANCLAACEPGAGIGTDDEADDGAGREGVGAGAWEEETEQGDGSRAAADMRAVLSGRRETFDMDSPCHSPDERRWFTMWTGGLGQGGESWAVVTHLDVPDRTLARREVERRAANRRLLAELLSHALRNPLAVASGDAEQAAADLDGGDERVRRLRGAFERMDRSLSEALVLVGRDRIPDADRGLVDLAEQARRAWTTVDTGPATLSVEWTASFRGSEDALRHVFGNLHRNAVEHGSTGGRPAAGDRPGRGSAGSRVETDDDADEASGVAVRVGPLDDDFYVADDGPGVSPALRDSLFESGVTTEPDGTGLDLAIVSRVVEAHGWTVDVSEARTGGARFEVTGVDLVPVDG